MAGHSFERYHDERQANLLELAQGISFLCPGGGLGDVCAVLLAINKPGVIDVVITKNVMTNEDVLYCQKLFEAILSNEEPEDAYTLKLLGITLPYLQKKFRKHSKAVDVEKLVKLANELEETPITSFKTISECTSTDDTIMALSSRHRHRKHVEAKNYT